MNDEKPPFATASAAFAGTFRQAVIKDARRVQELINYYADQELMLPRSLSELFETIRQYILYEDNGTILGVCGLHISWEDLAEVRALAVDPAQTSRGIGSALVDLALAEARRLGVLRVFTLTYVPGFFERKGFMVVDKNDFPRKIWSECVRCHKFPDCDETGMIINLDDMPS